MFAALVIVIKTMSRKLTKLQFLIFSKGFDFTKEWVIEVFILRL
ncbi:hypothetical protein LEP1GSC107_3166 [Leptospira interrogans serovar Grippotyphosa str. UI 12769]|nr:hypothetical protein LEP1GSC080_4806 [Leptospira interrogans str. FPW2026]EKP87389.1 hypothetical protein LEP1GSC020_0831 [Leptospira interrogans serovar Grippotyphosa str. 2006006986]EKR45421.1 hypothetical protein LEP1GSC097_3725 [Leptospira interrogans serovar Grippotyphosa str. UI 08368]EMN82226.1 hypothetical protein LEP1GSC106_0594 [Leptospira interrogans serovar Grippotyphosa str. UI 12764]EMN86520.1 hypothetical protein LEP1GSC107_3166 [Leptospira interrogans serovar Grippotyphosa st